MIRPRSPGPSGIHAGPHGPFHAPVKLPVKLQIEPLESRLCYAADLAVPTLLTDVVPTLISTVSPMAVAAQKHQECGDAEPTAITWYFAEVDPRRDVHRSQQEISSSSLVGQQALPERGEDETAYGTGDRADPRASETELCDFENFNNSTVGRVQELSESLSGPPVLASDQLLPPLSVWGQGIGLEFYGTQRPANTHTQSTHTHFASTESSMAESVISPSAPQQSVMQPRPGDQTPPTATPGARPAIAPLRQLPLPEGEGPDMADEPVRKPESSATLASPSGGLRSLAGIARPTAGLSSSLSASSTPLGELERQLPSPEVFTGSRPPYKSGPASSSEGPRWTALVDLAIRHAASPAHSVYAFELVDTDDVRLSRPQLAPVPELQPRTDRDDARGVSYQRTRLSWDDDASLDYRAAGLAMAHHVVPGPTAHQLPPESPRGIDLDDEFGASEPMPKIGAVDDSMVDDLLPELTDEELAGSSPSWYLAAIPMLLFIPRRLRRRMRSSLGRFYWPDA